MNHRKLLILAVLLLPAACSKRPPEAAPADVPAAVPSAPAAAAPAPEADTQRYRYLTLRRLEGSGELVFVKTRPDTGEGWRWDGAEWAPQAGAEALAREPGHEVVSIHEQAGDWRPRAHVPREPAGAP